MRNNGNSNDCDERIFKNKNEDGKTDRMISRFGLGKISWRNHGNKHITYWVPNNDTKKSGSLLKNL